MAAENHIKTNPVGIDLSIQGLQKRLFSILVSDWSLTDGDFYGRCYLNKKGDHVMPQWFTGGIDYKEVLYDDKISVTSIFYVDDNTGYDQLQNTNNVKLFMSFDMRKVYASIEHRADEEIIQDVVNILEKDGNGFQLTNIVRHESALTDFTLPDEMILNMQERLTLRFDLELKYKYSNC